MQVDFTIASPVNSSQFCANSRTVASYSAQLQATELRLETLVAITVPNRKSHCNKKRKKKRRESYLVFTEENLSFWGNFCYFIFKQKEAGKPD